MFARGPATTDQVYMGGSPSGSDAVTVTEILDRAATWADPNWSVPTSGARFKGGVATEGRAGEVCGGARVANLVDVIVRAGSAA
jgi:hypothetical protein